MEKTLFSTPELAEWLGVFHTTVRRWIEGGRIRGIRVGRNYKIPADEVIRILEGHGIPLPEVVRKYKNSKQRAARSGNYGDYQGSILRKLLIVEDIEDPAFVYRKASILGANQAFADLVGYSQADLIGIRVTDVMDDGSAEGICDFAMKRGDLPQKGPLALITQLKTARNGDRRVHITAGPLDSPKDVYLLVVREPGKA